MILKRNKALHRNRKGIMAKMSFGKVRVGMKSAGGNRPAGRGLGRIKPGPPAGRPRLRRAIKRNRMLLVTLLAVGALVALLNGIGVALHGQWFVEALGPVGLDLAEPLAQRMPARFGAATTFEASQNRILVFGGHLRGPGAASAVGIISSTLGAADLDTTYSYVGQKWTNRNPLHKPSPRGLASMVYDGARKNVVLFGGAALGQAPNDETWVWNGADWAKVNPPTSPPARLAASMVYDAHRKKVILFGGSNGSLSPGGNFLGQALDDTWSWDGSTWTKVKTPLSPSPRHSAAMEYDLCRGEAVLFGGLGPLVNNITAAPGETWIFNGTTWNQWTPEPGQISPTPRMGGAMTYSQHSGRVLLYGGLLVADTGLHTVPTDENLWMWNGTQWEHEVDNMEGFVIGLVPGLPVSPIQTPQRVPPRAYASMVFDPASLSSSRTHVFGGTADLRQGVPLPDHWNFVEKEGLVAGTLGYGCSNPVPIPADDTPAGGPVAGSQPQLRKTETRDEIQEIAQLPVLLGPDLEVKPPAPQGRCTRFQKPEDKEGQAQVSDTLLVTDPKRNRVYQFFSCTTGSPVRVLVEAYDATTLKPLGSEIVHMPGGLFSKVTLKGAPLHDAERGRLFLVKYGYLWVIQQDLIEKGVNPLVQKIAIPQGDAKIVSFFNHPKTGRAKVLIAYAGSNSAWATPVKVVQFDLEQKLAQNLPDWSSELKDCVGIDIDGGYNELDFTPPMLTRGGDRVYTTCFTQGTRASVVRIPVITSADGTETTGTPEVFPGPVGPERSWYDPQAERVLVLSVKTNGNTLWVFDGKISRYVGRVGLAAVGKPRSRTPGSGYGFDQHTGRFYALEPDSKSALGGLRVVDTRLTPVPQAANFGQFTHIGEADIGVLPPGGGLPTRLFVRRASGTTPTNPNASEESRKSQGDKVSRYPDGEPYLLYDEMHYKVLADLLPVPEQPELGKLDALTIPVAEAPGKTEVSFDAEGGAYGIRLRSVGGIAAALRPLQAAGAEEFASTESTLGKNGAIPACFYSDRQLAAGWVSQVRLSDLETTAQSLGLEVDASSKSDLEGPVTTCVPPVVSPATFGSTTKIVTDQLWPLLPFTQLNTAAGSQLGWAKHFKAAECVGESSENHKATLGDVYGSVDCKQGKGRAEGTARGALAGSAPSGYSLGQSSTSTVVASPADYSVGEGSSNVVVGRDPIKGVVVTSTAVAKAIKLPNLYIELVKTEAVVWANGRPGEKRATFTRTICGVVSPVFNKPEGCLSEDQQKQMVTNWNSGWKTNSKMSLPTPDQDFLKGSPGGYIAGVVKPLADEIQEQFFSRDFQKEVPGLEITFYKDTSILGEGRQILQLAAVKGVAAFGVQCNAELVYSPSAKGCEALAFEEEFTEELEEDEEALSSSDDAELDSAGSWEPVLPDDAPAPLALGSKIGRFLENLPLVRLLPIRQMGEALLAASVWLLLGLPLLLASQRFAMNRARGVD